MKDITLRYYAILDVVYEARIDRRNANFMKMTLSQSHSFIAALYIKFVNT